jgi:hypothetical protein
MVGKGALQHICSRHDKKTCCKRGSDMHGRTHHRRLPRGADAVERAALGAQKRQLGNDRQEAHKAKAARVNTGQEGGAAGEIDTEPDEAEDDNDATNTAIMGRWYGMHGKK